MKTVVQRVLRAEVRVAGEVVAAISRGALLLVGVERGDTEADAEATADKIAKLRFFPGDTPMDKTLAQAGGSALVVSQFTLAAAVHKGNRPSFTHAAEPGPAEGLYLRVARRLSRAGITTVTGQFGARMEVELVNDGPVTLLVFATDGRIA